MWCHLAAGAENARTSRPKIHRRLRLTGAWILLIAGRAHAAEPVYETVVVAAPPPAQLAREDEAASSTTVTADRTPRTAESLPQLLAEMPGLSITRTGGLGSFATLSVRGSSANQVQVYLDGVPLGWASGGGVDLGLIPVSGLDRIEVYRGVTPIAFGATGLGGVVSLSSAPPQDSGAGAYLGGGSFATGLTGVNARWAGTQMRLSASANLFSSAGDFSYPNDNGTAFNARDDTTSQRQNNQLRQLDALVRGQADLPGRRQLSITTSVLRREQGLPGDGTQVTHDSTLGTDRLLVTTFYESRDDLGSGGRLRVQVHATTMHQRLHDPLPEIAATPTDTNDRSQSWGMTLTGSRPLASWLRLAAVLDGRRETFDPSDALATSLSMAPGTRTFGAAGTEAHVLVAPLALDVIPSLRLEVAHDDVSRLTRYIWSGGDVRGVDAVLPAARLALMQRPDAGVLLRANLGRYGRMPSMMERYGNTGFLLGKPDLKSETGVNADVGARWERAGERLHCAVDGALFAAWVNDLIAFRQLGHWMKPDNVGRARVLGAEASIQMTWGRHLRGLGQGTYTDARDESDVAASTDRQLPNRPRVRAYARPELRDLPLGGRWRWGLYADADFTGGNYLDSSNLIRLPSRLLFGAGAHVDAPHWGARLVASAMNLGASSVVDFAGYPLPGRSLYVTLQWSTPNSENKE